MLARGIAAVEDQVRDREVTVAEILEPSAWISTPPTQYRSIHKNIDVVVCLLFLLLLLVLLFIIINERSL